MKILRTVLPLIAGLMIGLSAHAATPPADAGIKKAGPTCESCCCKKHEQMGSEMGGKDGIRKAGASCKGKGCCGDGGCCGKGGCCGGDKDHGMKDHGMHDAEMMKARRQHMQAQRAIAAELKTAKTDAQRVKLMQRYIENMDAQMGEMMSRMDKMHDRKAMAKEADDSHEGHDHGAPAKK